MKVEASYYKLLYICMPSDLVCILIADIPLLKRCRIPAFVNLLIVYCVLYTVYVMDLFYSITPSCYILHCCVITVFAEHVPPIFHLLYYSE